MKAKAADFLVYDQESGTYREDPEQVVRDDVEKHYWRHVGQTILKDWRLYLMLVPMLLVFLFWRYFPMYELLGCFKVSDNVKPVSEQLFSGFSYFRRLLFAGDGLSTDFWRALIALLTGAERASVIGFYTTDSLSMLFTFVIIWIARRLDGVYEDQIHYLLRINAKEGTEKEVNYES